MHVLMQPGGKQYQGTDPAESTFLGYFLTGLILLSDDLFALLNHAWAKWQARAEASGRVFWEQVVIKGPRLKPANTD